MGKIPKIIHYCWVGPAPKPQSVLYCIESWKKHCPDYEIIEWNESNYDFTKNSYMKQAYEAKKWGFVPDYARLDIVYEHGGIYLDTDVELVKSFDSLLEQDAFMGFENTGDGEFFVNCGHGFGAVPHHEIIREARDLYDQLSFYKPDGSVNLLASPFYTTQTLRKFGLVQENRQQKLPGMTVYSSEVLCPKNFRTGKLSVTSNTVSIHHFTASWLDEKIKKELAHQQAVKKRFGDFLGAKVLYVESVFEKYSFSQMLLILPKKMVGKCKRKMIYIWELMPDVFRLYQTKFSSEGKGVMVLLDTAMDSDNCGDGIIMENCEKQLAKIMDTSELGRVPTHRVLNAEEYKLCQKAKKKILCGTNILSGHMGTYGLWRMSKDLRAYKNSILMGVGFDSEAEDADWYSKKLFSVILDKKGIHSVRDSFSEAKLKRMGIKNVLNTGCPTMWGLTPEHCANIPNEKAKNVICTVTDYCRDYEADKAMLEILLSSYDKVYLWIQGRYDEEYINDLEMKDRIVLIPTGLENYDQILEQDDLDYVGTRLHAGVRAMSLGHRSIVIAIDNRARAIAADTGLPIVERADVKVYLKEKLDSSLKTEIHLPIDNIKKWKQQFLMENWWQFQK